MARVRQFDIQSKAQLNSDQTLERHTRGGKWKHKIRQVFAQTLRAESAHRVEARRRDVSQAQHATVEGLVREQVRQAEVPHVISATEHLQEWQADVTMQSFQIMVLV